MVAIVSGNSLGVLNSSLYVLGARGVVGDPSQGRAGERVYLNAASGNLVVQNRDELVLGRGPDLSLLRTYNSQGLLSDDNGDNWRLGIYRKVYNLSGTVNTAGSTVTRVAEDGAECVYTYDTASGQYLGHDGAEAYDTLAYDASTQTWTWTDGGTQIKELYDGANGGRLTQMLDADGNGLAFTYNAAGLITQVVDADGETTYLDYTGANLSQLRTVTADGRTLVRTRYAYDASNRLSQVITDLSPEDASIADGNVYTVSYTYDGASRRVASMSQSDGTSIAFAYVLVGADYRLASVTDALGQVTSFAYDAAARTTTVTDALGLVKVFTYDAAGQLLSVTEPTIRQSASASAGALVTNDLETHSVTGNLNTSLLQTTVPYGLNSSLLQTTLGINGSQLQTTDSTTYNLNSSLLAAPGWRTPSAIATNDYNAALGLDNAGNGFRIWRAAGQILVSRYEGSAWQAPVTLAITGNVFPNLYVHSSGNAVAIWGQSDGGVYVARYVNGTWQTPQRVNGTLPGVAGTSSTPCSAAINANGDAVAAWVVTGGTQFSSVFHPSVGWGLPVMTSPGAIAPGLPCLQAAISPTGVPIVVSIQSGTLSNLATIPGSIPVVIGTSVGGDSSVPQVGFDDQGNATAVWTQNGNLFAKRWTNGTWSAAVQLNSVSGVTGNTVRLSVNGSGNAIVGWGQTGGNAYCARFVGGAWQTAELMGASSGAAFYGSINANGEAAFIRGSATIPQTALVRRYVPGTGWSGDTAFGNSGQMRIAMDARGNIVATCSNSLNNLAIYDAKPYYQVGSGATWSSIAAALYGSPNVGDELQAALGSPALVTGLRLMGFPSTLTDTFSVPPYYLVRVGDTWQSIATYLYGGAIGATALQTALGNPPLTAGSRLTGFPASLAVAPYYKVQAGDTWSSIGTYLFGSANVGDELQLALGNPALASGTYLTGIPASLNDRFAPYYTVQAGDTWSSIAAYLYSTSQVAGELQAALGNPALAVGARLSNPPASLTHAWTTPIPPYYVVKPGDTWATIAAAIYNIEDADGIAVVQAAAGNPTLVVGLRVYLPVNLPYLIKTQYSYDALGNVTSVTDARGNVVTYGYDANGNRVLERDAAGNTVTCVYGARNELLAETTYLMLDPDGAGAGQAASPLTARYAYDAAGHLRFAISAEGRVTEHRYNGFGQRIAQIRYTASRFDVSALAPSATLTEGQLLAWLPADRSASLRSDTTYDFRGQVASVTAYQLVDAAGNGVVDGMQAVTRYVYDQAGNLLQTIDPRGAATPDPNDYTTSYAYDGLGRLLSSTDALGRTSVTQYDDANRKVVLTLANGLVNTSTYDAAGNLVSVLESANGSALGQTNYFYDADGRLRRTEDPTGVRTHVLYDEAGRRVADIDGNGSFTEYRYDAAGNLTRTIHYATAVSAASLVALADANGRPTNAALTAIRPAASAADRSTWNAYDAANRLMKSVDEAGAVTQYFYDGAGRATDVLRFATPIATAGLMDALSAASINPLSSADDRLSRSFYDADGKLRGALDGEGYLVEYKYDAAGQLVETIDYATATNAALRASGTLAQLIPAASTDDIHGYALYNARGQVAATVDGEGYLTENVYDAAGNKTQTIRYATRVAFAAGATLASLRPAASAQDQVTVSTYTGLDRVASTAAPDGTLTQYFYDEVGNLTRTVKAANTSDVRTLLAQYDKQGRLTAELSANGAAQLTGGQTQAQIDPIWAAYAIRYGYDAAGRRTSMTDADGRKTLFYYNADGALTHTINALGEVQESVYNALGQLVQTVQYGTRLSAATLATLSGGLVDDTLTSALAALANAVVDSRTSYAYTLAGNLARTVDPLGNAVSQAFNAFGEVANQSQAIGAGQTLDHTYAYDRRGLLTRMVWDPTGINTQASTVYDAFGRAIQTTDARGNVRTTSYDKLGRTVATSDPLNNAERTTYDAFDRVLTQTDALGKITTYSYDTANRSVRVTTPEGVITTSVKNRHGETISITDGRGNTTAYSYDRDGNLVRVDTPDAGSTTNLYDNANLLTDTIDAIGTKTTYTYDAANRVLTRTVDSGAGRLNLVTTYAYDAKGQAAVVTDANGVVTRTEFDLKGEVKSITVDSGVGHLNLTTAYTYDARGKKLTVTEGAGSVNPRVTQYVYDKLGRLTQERVDTSGINATTTYVYDKNDNVAKKIDALGNVTRYAYDANDRLVYTIDALGGVTKNDYDANGHVLRYTAYATPIGLAALADIPSVADIATRVTASAADENKSYVYDSDGREIYCIDALGGVTQKSYDASGNVVREVFYANPVAPTTALTQAAVAAAIGAGSANDRVTRTVYDAANRAIFTIDAAGYVTQRIYDGGGHVVKEIRYANALQGELAAGAAPQVLADPVHDQTTLAIYDAAGRMRYGVDAEGYVTERRFDALGHEIRRLRYADRVVVPQNPTEAAMAAALPASVPASAVSEEAHYDAAGRLIETVDGEGAVTRNAYDAVGNKTDTTRAYGTSAASTTHYLYDAAGRVLEETQGYGAVEAATTRYVLDALGNRIRIVDPRGVELAETDRAWALETRKAFGLVDASGNAKLATALTAAEKDGLRERYTSTQAFDALGRKTRSTDPLGGVTSTSYDAFGNAVKIVDPRGNAGYFYFDALNRAVLHVDPEGYATQTAYNRFGNATKSVRYANRAIGAATVGAPPALAADPLRDQVTITEYDARDRQVKVTDAEGYYEQFTYDAFDNTLTKRNKRGGVTSYTYDSAGHVLSETLPISSRTAAGQSVAVVNRYEYDARGNRTRQIEASGLPEQRVTVFEYDKLDRQVRKIGEAAHVFDTTALAVSGTAVPVEQNRYDARGNVIETIAANGARALTYYDALDRKVAQIDALGALTVWRYNSGEVPFAELAYGDAVALPAAAGGIAPAPVNAANVREKRFVHDANNALLTTTVANVLLGEQAIGASAFSSFTQDVVTKSVYDADGNEVQLIDARGHSTFRYYDRLGQKVLEVDPGNYVTRWDRDASGNVVRETKYSNRLSLIPTVTSDPAALIRGVDRGATDPATGVAYDPLKRVTEFGYDRMNRMIERRVLAVESGSVDVNGSLAATTTGIARVQIQYDGLGNITRQIDATGAVSDATYDAMGRNLRQQGAQFTDFEGAVVRPTKDFEYDGLNHVRRELVRGKDDTTEADDRVTTYQYDYGFGSRLLGQTDPTGAATSFFYDVAGNVVHKTLPRQDADGALTLDRTTFAYDALGREILRKDAGTGQTNETRYDVYGEITGKRVNGGGLGAAWQETADYDKLGRVWKTNSGDGVYKVYLYDANGNATLLIQSAGPNFVPLTLDQVMALPGDQKFLTVSQYDARNKLVGVWQPKMNISHQQAAIEQFITQATGTQFSGGAVSVGAVVIRSKTSAVVATGSVGALAPMPMSASFSLGFHEYVDHYGFDDYVDWVEAKRYENAFHTLALSLPNTSALGTGNVRIAFSMPGVAGSGAWGAWNPFNSDNWEAVDSTLAGVDLTGPVTSLSMPYNVLSWTFTFGESGHLAGTWRALVADNSQDNGHEIHGTGYMLYDNAFNSRPYSYSIFKQTDFGDIPLGSYSGVTGAVLNSFGQYQGGLNFGSDGTTPLVYTSAWGSGTTLGAGMYEVEFRDQPNSANRLILQYRVQGSNSGWSTASLSRKFPNSNWYVFDWRNRNMPSGVYEMRYTAVDSSGNVLNSESGTMQLYDSAPSASQNLEPFGGFGRAYLDEFGKLNILEQGADVRSLTVRFRHTGTSEAWSTVNLSPTSFDGAVVPGWFVLDPAASGMSGAYDYSIEARTSTGTLVNKALGSFTVGNADSVSELTAYQVVRFDGQPPNAATMKLSYRPSGSTGAYTTIFLPKTGAGAFEWDALSLVADRLANYVYEYQYQTFDAGNALVNAAHGTVQVGATNTVLGHFGDYKPTIVSFNPPQTNAMKLVLQYRNAGSTGAYSIVTLTRSSGAQPFVWDASAVVPPGTTASLDYIYDLYDSANAPVKSADGTAVHVLGVLSIGAASAPTQLKWVIVGTSNQDWAIHRQQTYDAFGDVVQEIDGLGRVTDYRYNGLGLMVEKRDPETDITLVNGFVQRGRPTTSYTYDLAGRLVATKDPNGNLSTQGFVSGETDKVSVEFHADGGQKRTAFDIFGDARTLTDEDNRTTLQEFDKASRLTRMTRPARAGGTPGNETGAALAAVEIFAYDQAGNRIRRINGLGSAEKTYYDGLGRVTGTTSYAGNATTYSYVYDSGIAGLGGTQVGGWVKTTTDPTLHTMLDKQELFGRVVSHKDLGDHVFTYTYNYAGRLTAQTATTGQNIAYDYYANGYLKSINDQATSAYTKYEYDAEGNRTLETYQRNPGTPSSEFYQIAEVEYDELNRVKGVVDKKAEIRYEYDANGNRRRVWSYYHDGIDGNMQVQEYWYAYDSMDRFVVTMGQLSSGGARGASATDASVSVVKGSTGVEIGYDAASQRRMAIYGSDGHREDYTYTADGYLEDTLIGGVLRARRSNDVLGRVVKYQEFNAGGAPVFGRSSAYDADSKVTTQLEYNGAIGSTLPHKIVYDYLDAPNTNNNAGPLSVTTTSEGGTTVTSYYGYDWWDSAKEKTITAQPYNVNAPGWLPGYSNFEYDVNGHLKQVDDPMAGRAIRYVTDAQGLVLMRDEISGGTANAQGVVVNAGTVNKHHSFYYLDGHRIGDVGNDGPMSVSYAEQLAAGRPRGNDAHRDWKPISSADFDQNFEPINASYPAATGSVYTVRAGDTLRSIALAVWGDGDLWYLIADANGLSATSALAAGQTLTIPNKVTNVHNNSQTYKVYDPGEAVGDTSPTLPDPPPPPMRSVGGGGCGVLGMIIVIIVVIVVAYFTGEYVGGVLGVGGEAGTSIAGDVVVGAASAAAGNAAGQVVGMAIGTQDKFSWSSVRTAALTGGLTQGLGFGSIGGSELLGQVATYGARSVVTQRVNMANGQQKKFSWRAVAASIISGIAGGATPRMGDATLGPVTEFGQRLVSGAIYQAVDRRKVDWQGVAANAFGSMVGHEIVYEMRASNLDASITNSPEKTQAAKYAMRAGLNDADATKFADLVGKLADKKAEFIRYLYKVMAAGDIQKLKEILSRPDQTYGKGRWILPPPAPEYTEPDVPGAAGPVQVFDSSGRFGESPDEGKAPHLRFIGRTPEATREEKAMFRFAMMAADYTSSDRFDNQDGSSSYLHTMKGDLTLPGGGKIELSSDQAKTLTNLWVRELFGTAQSSRAEGNTGMFNFMTGVAMHTMSDAASPEHRELDENGKLQLQYWSKGLPFVNKLAHGLGETFDPGRYSHAQAATDMTYWWFKNGDLPAGDLVGIFGVDRKGESYISTPGEAKEQDYQRSADYRRATRAMYPEMRYRQPLIRS